MKNTIHKINSFSLAFNSSIIAITTFTLAILLHELSHFLLSMFFGLNAEFHSNYVLIPNATEIQKICVAGIGPLMSLFFGIVFLQYSKKIVTPSIKKIFFLWLGLNNVLFFLGYMLIAPVVKTGDTGMVLDFFKIPLFVSILLALLCFMITRKLFQHMVQEFTYYKSDGTFDKNNNANNLILIPIVSIIIVNSMLNYPSPALISYLPTLVAPLAFLSIYFKYKRIEFPTPVCIINKISLNYLSLFIIFIILFRLFI